MTDFMTPLFPLPAPSLPDGVQRAPCKCGATVTVFGFAIDAECMNCRQRYRVHADMTITEDSDDA